VFGLGTVINAFAVLVGAGIGTLVGARLPEGMRQTAMHAIGLVTVLVGIQSFLRFDNPLVPLVSVILGLVVGELLDLDGRLRRFGDALERRFSKGGSPVSRAFVTTSLLFCVGPLTFLGSLQDGISGNYRLLALKSALDFVASLSFASVLGWGVLLSAGSVLVVQGGPDARRRAVRFVHERTHDPGDDLDRRRAAPGPRAWPTRAQGSACSEHAAGAYRSSAAHRARTLVAVLRDLQYVPMHGPSRGWCLLGPVIHRCWTEAMRTSENPLKANFGE